MGITSTRLSAQCRSGHHHHLLLAQPLTRPRYRHALNAPSLSTTMGRQVYTPQTLSYLAHVKVAGGTSSEQASTSAPASASTSSSTLPPTPADSWTTPTIVVGTAPQRFVRQPLAANRSLANGTGSNIPPELFDIAKPLAWSERSFDPDDENLPIVIERPIRAYDDEVQRRVLALLEGIEVNYEICDNEGRFLYDTDDNPLPTGPLEQELAEAHLARRLRLRRQSTSASNVNVHGGVNDEDEDEDEIEVDWEEQEQEQDSEEDETVQHGNGGYYDFPEAGRLAIDTNATGGGLLQRLEAAAAAAAGEPDTDTIGLPPSARSGDSFSPSAGIFHTHTLPFSLPPNPNALNAQRRISNSSATAAVLHGSGSSSARATLGPADIQHHHHPARDINDIM